MHMHKLAASLSLIAATAVALNVTRVAPTDSNVAPLKMCADMPRPTDSSELQVGTCLVSAAPAASRRVGGSAVPSVAPTLLCVASAAEPGVTDAQNLCNTPLTDPLTVAAALNNSTCTCHFFHLASAEFQACNCDPCSSVQFTGTKAQCLNILTNCVEHGVGGYEMALNPNAYTVLFLANADPAPPIPVPISC
ncbi:hypothetical protein L226DRAFT_614008 [Lentinus tigrinus ALCF2SS1-7]|uniref:Extracellular membrane protein CFEM domain-containing protein n=1 Tax=Lentinus tigrinus ALCF2SS1-6 TaxID=1328759 RepID=A0A5C2S5U5_9APHY|nr:hypothetical protein L227DRAFT_576384 [Lentinus tigrinus ALCF2SS1-6]RPD73493.1 hypothetical protein L226DRAFT_614008 [Lentinus tigrinus ALCF2SS1-7]